MPAARRTARGVLAGSVGLLALALGGCTGPAASPPEEPASTPLASYDVGRAVVARGAFCDLVDAGAVADVLGGPPARVRAWGDGDRLPFGEGDVSHEWGCQMTGADGVTLRAWVFGPPVAAARARELTDELADELPDELTDGRCRRLADRPDFGSPGGAVSCRVEGGERLVRFAGLFGDAWLTCELHAPAGASSGADRSAVVERTGRWCVAVLEAAATTR